MTDSAQTNQEDNPPNGRSELPIADEIRTLLLADHPQSVRQVFYEAVAAGILQKSPTEIAVLVRLLDGMETRGEIPHDWMKASVTASREGRSLVTVENRPAPHDVRQEGRS
jgi:hypothetical protein